MERLSLLSSLLLFAGIVPARATERPARSDRIAWVRDLGTAERLARTQKKLVMEFLLLGDLSDANC